VERSNCAQFPHVPGFGFDIGVSGIAMFIGAGSDFTRKCQTDISSFDIRPELQNMVRRSSTVVKKLQTDYGSAVAVTWLDATRKELRDLEMRQCLSS
jgi:hypothetical protein